MTRAALRPTDDFVSALAAERGLPLAKPATSAIEPATPAPVVRIARDNDIELGSGRDGAVGLDLGRLIEGRLLVQGNSGAGKSTMLRRIFEQAFGRVQQVLVDPDGEFSTLAEVFDVAVLTAPMILRTGGSDLARHLRQHRYSAVLDLSEATSEQRVSVVAELAAGLIDAPAEHWQPLLFLVDEAQTFAPHHDAGDVSAETRKAAIAALADLMGRGRKRGVAGVIATQRLAETSKAVASKATNVVIGRTIFDRDLERAGALLGFTAGHSKVLRTLSDGEFLGIGPALAGPRRVRFRVGPVQSRHKGVAPAIDAPPAMSAAAAVALLAELPSSTVPATSPLPETTVPTRRWSDAEDAIIRDGYARELRLSEIADALVAEGFKRRSLGGVSARGQALGCTSAARSTKWTHEEEEILIAAYAEGTSIAAIRARFAAAGYDRPFGGIQMRAVHLGISGDRVNYWTDEETAIALAGLEAGKTHGEVRADLKAAGYERGPTAMFKFAQKHGVTRCAEPWTADDIETLRLRYEAKVPVRDISAELGKPIAGIRSKASVLGFKQRIAWTDADRAILTEAAERGDRLVDAAARIGRPYTNVAQEARRMNLTFKKVGASREGGEAA